MQAGFELGAVCSTPTLADSQLSGNLGIAPSPPQKALFYYQLCQLSPTWKGGIIPLGQLPWGFGPWARNKHLSLEGGQQVCYLGGRNTSKALFVPEHGLDKDP